MKTTRILLKVPFYKHPAGTVFELAAQTEPAEWPEDERSRERLNLSNKQVYLLPDGGRGFAVSLPVSDTLPCPDRAFEGMDTRKGECRITRVITQNEAEDRTASETPPCGQLRETEVSIAYHAVTQAQCLVLSLPLFAEVAEKMVLLDRLRGEQVLEYVLRNYQASDRQLTWDVSDLNPGFYELRVCFPGAWFHALRFIKYFPFLAEAAKIPSSPQAIWSLGVEKGREVKMEAKPDLLNEVLALCLEWGAMFNQATQAQMMQRYPHLSQSEADELDRLAREVRSYVYQLCEQELEGKIAEYDLHFTLHRRYPWVNAANFMQMKQVGMYYARR